MMRPILFNTGMMRAILAGRKTATRRRIDIDISNQFDVELDRKTVIAYINQETGDSCNPAEICRYQPGDIMYVRETWRVGAWDIQNQMIAFDYKDGTCGEFTYIHDRELLERLVNQSREDARKAGCKYNGADFIWEKGKSPCRWHPSIHMPKEAARIFLRVTDVRVERLKDMTLDDFLAEGVVLRPEAFNDPENAYMQSKELFIHIWDSTIKKEQHDLYGWEANPWAWVIEFERCKRSEEWCV